MPSSGYALKARHLHDLSDLAPPQVLVAEAEQYLELSKPVPRSPPQGTTEVLPSLILSRISSTSQRGTAPCCGPLRRAAARWGPHAGLPPRLPLARITVRMQDAQHHHVIAHNAI